jgi:hypothetical protein
MGALLGKIKERSRGVTPKQIEVPELGDESGPLVVYMHPLTLAQRSKLMPLISKNDMTAIAKMVVMSARDEDGSPIFDMVDEKEMARSKDTGWIIRLSQAVADDLTDGAEELGEN